MVSRPRPCVDTRCRRFFGPPILGRLSGILSRHNVLRNTAPWGRALIWVHLKRESVRKKRPRRDILLILSTDLSLRRRVFALVLCDRYCEGCCKISTCLPCRHRSISLRPSIMRRLFVPFVTSSGYTLAFLALPTFRAQVRI